MSKRAVGIIRVSQTRGREGESFHSPQTQRAAIERACEANGWRLVDVFEELDVSGTRPLAKRPGLKLAVEAIEASKADLIVVAYFDRLLRSMQVKIELVERVEKAGGDVHALDAGQITNGGASRKLTAGFFALLAEYQADTARERVREAQVRAVDRGALPWSRTPLGYRRREEDGTLEVDPATKPLVVRAYEMRAEGEPISAIRAFLRSNGIERSQRGVQELLASRVYLGEVRFGDLFNPAAHPPIVDPELHQRVQNLRVRRGPRPKSDALLARLDVLVCSSCGSRMSSAVMPQGGGYPIYRCSSSNDCPKHMVISAELVEREVVAYVKSMIAGLEGRASADSGVAEALAELERRQGALDAAVRSFADAGLVREPVAAETLSELRRARDEARDRHDEAVQRDETLSLTVTVDDWDEFTRDTHRDLIKAVVRRVVVHPGRGAGRIEIAGRVESD